MWPPKVPSQSRQESTATIGKLPLFRDIILQSYAHFGVNLLPDISQRLCK